MRRGICCCGGAGGGAGDDLGCRCLRGESWPVRVVGSVGTSFAALREVLETACLLDAVFVSSNISLPFCFVFALSCLVKNDAQYVYSLLHLPTYLPPPRTERIIAYFLFESPNVPYGQIRSQRELQYGELLVQLDPIGCERNQTRRKQPRIFDEVSRVFHVSLADNEHSSRRRICIDSKI